MRFSGYALLLIGFLLCITIAWAAIGFFAMGFGLICLLVVDAQKRAAKVAVVAARPVTPKPANLPAHFDEGQSTREINSEHRWKSIVQSDPDVAEIARILSGYGQKYVDQFASVYIIFEDKVLLPIMLDLIVASAKRPTHFVETNVVVPRASFNIGVGNKPPSNTSFLNPSEAPELITDLDEQQFPKKAETNSYPAELPPSNERDVTQETSIGLQTDSDILQALLEKLTLPER
jgi:hypothetical protein